MWWFFLGKKTFIGLECHTKHFLHYWFWIIDLCSFVHWHLTVNCVIVNLHVLERCSKIAKPWTHNHWLASLRVCRVFLFFDALWCYCLSSCNNIALVCRESENVTTGFCLFKHHSQCWPLVSQTWHSPFLSCAALRKQQFSSLFSYIFFSSVPWSLLVDQNLLELLSVLWLALQTLFLLRHFLTPDLWSFALLGQKKVKIVIRASTFSKH